MGKKGHGNSTIMHLGCASHTQKHGGVIILMSRDELAAFSHDLLSVAVPSVKRTHSHTHTITHTHGL